MVVIMLILLGLIVGSFLNVVIYRLPAMIMSDDNTSLNLCCPRSHCRSCQHTLAWYDLVPVISFILCRGQCRHCQQRISWQYPIVECIYSGLLLFTYFHFGLSMMTLVVGLLNALLLALWVIDFQHQLLPDALTFSALWLGLIYSAIGGFVTPAVSIITAASAYLVMRLLADSYRLIRKQEGMGGGDIKLIAAIGAWFGLGVLEIVMIGVVLALIVALILLATKRLEWQQKMAFGPFLIIGIWLYIFVIYPSSLFSFYF